MTDDIERIMDAWREFSDGLDMGPEPYCHLVKTAYLYGYWAACSHVLSESLKGGIDRKRCDFEVIPGTGKLLIGENE